MEQDFHVYSIERCFLSCQFTAQALRAMYHFSSAAFDRFAYSSVNIDNPFRSGETQPRNSDQLKRENFDDINELFFR